MKGRPVFVDSNVWIYLYSTDSKAVAARATIEKHFENIIISTQVVGEIFHALSRKGIRTKEEARLIVNDLVETFNVADITTPMVTRAMEISVRYGFSYWDSLIIATALASDCASLFSEDLQNNQLIDKRLTIVNPFQ